MSSSTKVYNLPLTRKGDLPKEMRNVTTRKPIASGSSKMGRRNFLQASAITGMGAALLPFGTAARAAESSPASPPATPAFELDELTLADLQAGMQSGKFTARSLAEKYI